ncbi:MAG: glycosyltransferase family 2 protein [Ignavibacteriaceae bacterium]|nr:glycosyltransferase family 2 protein [Ignavibacteriaceae bacterium]
MNSTSLKNKTAAVIPFYNEEKKLEEAVSKSLQFVDFVFAVNDGSTDNSANLIINKKNVCLINLPKNMGKGFALKAGLLAAEEKKFEYAVTLDADMQHTPDYIPQFLNALKDNDMVIGNRLNNFSNMPIHRRFSNLLTSKLLSIKCKQKIKDSQCGFRVFRLSSIKNILPDEPGFEAESEMIVKAVKHGLKISFVNIPAIYGDEESKMRSLEAIKGFTKIMFKKF